MKDGVISTVPAKLEPPLAFAATFYEDKEGTIWVGTWGNGLVRIRGDEIKSCSSRDGLPEENVLQVLEDDLGYFWMRGLGNIFRVSKRELDSFFSGEKTTVRSTVFGRGHGLKATESDGGGAQPTAVKGWDGALWFTTCDGVATVSPAELKGVKPPVVSVEEVVVDGAAVPRGVVGGELVIPPGKRRLEFHYTGLTFDDPGSIQFRHRLDGFDEEWVDAGRRRFAVYTHLLPGKYSFRVLARSSDGTWNEDGPSVALRVRPFFYQTSWFYALGLLALASLIAVAHAWRVRHLNARRKELAAQVDAALGQIKRLRGLLPICAACKRIRDDAGYWNQIEVYIHDHSEAEFTHGICPECVKRLYPQLSARRGE